MKTAVMIVMALTVTLFSGCIIPGRHGGLVLVPPLPPLVVLDAEPYYVHEGYHYHYQNNDWYYAHSRSGPWAPLPRDHYPREVKFKKGGPGRDEGRNPERQER